MPFCRNCGAQKTRLNRDSLCSSCNDEANKEQNNDSENLDGAVANNDSETNKTSDDFWKQMDSLFDKKLNDFEEKLNNNIKEEITKAIDPMKDEIEKLATANKKLNAELTVMKAKQKEEKERNDQITKILKEHQITMAKSDKEARLKRLLLAGVPEEPTTINEVICENDIDKVIQVLARMKIDNINVQCRRIGPKDQGVENRPRYLQLEFANINDKKQYEEAK